MSDYEFDNYLALLSRLLRLGGKQRDAIAGELRAHLEDRLDELLAGGVPREQAVRQALEEFGDAAGLAAEFVSISRSKRQRWIMRLTTASVAAMVLIAAGIFTFWPGGNAGPGAAVLIAQDPRGGLVAAAAAPPLTARQKLQSKLDQTADVEFADTPLNDAIEFFHSTAGIQFVFRRQSLEDAGVSVDMPVSLSLKNVKVRTLLDLTLEQLELTYVTKDDLILITTPEEAETPRSMLVRVYDCRELLALPRPPGSMRPKAAVGGGGFFAVEDEPPRKVPAAGDAYGAPPAAGGAPAAPAVGTSGDGGGALQSEVSDAENLIAVITTTIDPEIWVEVGGPGSIAEYKGLLTISATQKVHEKVERLLNMLHQAAGLKEQQVKVVE
jgi:hypothetical protein